MKKIIYIYENWYWEFELPEEFAEAEEAHEVEGEGVFELLDWPCEDLESVNLGFIEDECLIRVIQ